MKADALKVLFEEGHKASEETRKILTIPIKDERGVERIYSANALTLITPPLPPLPATLAVATLAGLVDLLPFLDRQIEGSKVMLHISSATQVNVVPETCDEFGRRPVLAHAVAETPENYIGRWLGHEEFAMWMQYGFAMSVDREYAFNTASKLTIGTTMISEDNGIAQQVTLRTGIENKASEVIKNRLMLAPWRTFREIAQPTSDFVFRVRDGGGDPPQPQCRLIEADGGTWRIEAAQSIATFLEAAITAAKLQNKVIL